MKMTNSKLSPESYEKLKRFIGLYVDWFMHKWGKAEDHPTVFIAHLEKESMSNARKGVLMAIDGIVEHSSAWSNEEVAKADAMFTAHGTFTLTEIRRIYSQKYARILKRGRIRSEDEYYFLKGVRDGICDVDQMEHRRIDELLTDYEERIASNNSGRNT